MCDPNEPLDDCEDEDKEHRISPCTWGIAEGLLEQAAPMLLTLAVQEVLGRRAEAEETKTA